MSRWIFLPLHLLRLLFAGAGTVVVWILWLALIVIAVYQASIAIRREVVVPDWVQSKLVASLAESGLTVSTGTVSFDPTGRAVIQDLVISELGSNEPLVTVRAAAIELDPLLLLTRRIEIHAFEFSGASLHLPALRSPSGRNEAVLESIAGRLRPSGDRVTLDGISGRFGDVEFTVAGSVLRPNAVGSGDIAPPALGAVRDLRTAWLRTAQKALEALPQIDGIRAPRLAIDITQTRRRTFLIRAEALAEQVTDEPARRIHVEHPRALAQLTLELDGDSFHAGSVDLAGKPAQRDFRGAAHRKGSRSPRPGVAAAALGSRRNHRRSPDPGTRGASPRDRSHRGRRTVLPRFLCLCGRALGDRGGDLRSCRGAAARAGLRSAE